MKAFTAHIEWEVPEEPSALLIEENPSFVVTRTEYKSLLIVAFDIFEAMHKIKLKYPDKEVSRIFALEEEVIL